jgi:mono/diheme cytochrome c family protein
MKPITAITLIAMILGALWMGNAGAQTPRSGDSLSADQLAARGAGLAEMWCNACHVTGTGRTEDGMDASPPFERLAPLVAADPDRYRALLSAPHYPMRDITLSRDEIAALLVYIGSLEDRKN